MGKARYEVTFVLEVEEETLEPLSDETLTAREDSVEEALTSVVDDELYSHRRSGMRRNREHFLDALGFRVRRQP